MFFVYVLKNKNGLIYVGQTNCLDDRLRRHNSDLCISTKNRGPWELVYKEEYENRSEAFAREKKLKMASAGRRWIRDFLNK